MLVASDPGDRQFAAQYRRVNPTEVPGTVPHVGQDGRWNAEQLQQLVIPAIGGNVIERGPAGIGRIGDMQRPAGQLPDQPAVDSAEGQLPGLGPGSRAVHTVEDPGDLGGREIGVQHKSGAVGHKPGMSGIAQSGTDVRRAPVLPDDGVVDRITRRAIPDQRRLALIGDADCLGPIPGLLRSGERFTGGGADGRPDDVRVMLDPTRPGIDLLEFALRGGHDLVVRCEDNSARTCRALVDRQQRLAFGKHHHPSPHLALCRSERVTIALTAPEKTR